MKQIPKMPEEYKGEVKKSGGYTKTAPREWTILEIAKMSDEELTYEKGRFLRIIPQIKERTKTRKEMPYELHSLISGLAGNLAIESQNENKK